MLKKDKLLNINKEYSYDVSIKNGNAIFAGKLSLSPLKCTLNIMGERKPDIDFNQLAHMICSNHKQSFLLYELTFIKSHSRFLRNELDDIVFFEFEFDIGFIISTAGYFNSIQNVIGLTIDSPMINKWIGHTKLQQDLIMLYESKSLDFFNMDNIEFNKNIRNYGNIIVSYSCQTHSDPHYTYSSGAKFPPKLHIQFEGFKITEDLHTELKKIYNLMAFLIGGDFKINTIQALGSSTDSCIYIPSKNKVYKRDYPVFPLGHNLRFNSLCLPELPLECFSNYYHLSDADQALFSRYMQYKRMTSNEEKFLGYFRLLEKLTYVKKSYVSETLLLEILNKSRNYLIKKLNTNNKNVARLISRIKHLNNTKYNTEKCISDFYISLPQNIKDYVKNDDCLNLSDICKLRNDITHANDYIIDEYKLYRYISFIEILLYQALLQKIEIPPTIGAFTSSRIN